VDQVVANILLIVGRIRAPESLFYYDVPNGLAYNYYNGNSSRSYLPVFDIQPTYEQQQQAENICTVDGEFNTACAYDYYATGNENAAAVTADVNQHYVSVQNELGLFAIWSRR